MYRRMLASLMALILLVGMLPAPAMASEEAVPQETLADQLQPDTMQEQPEEQQPEEVTAGNEATMPQPEETTGETREETQEETQGETVAADVQSTACETDALPAQQSVEQEVFLSSLYFSALPSGATQADALVLVPAFSPEVTEYTLMLPDYGSDAGMYLYAALDETAGDGVQLRAEYIPAGQEAVASYPVTSGDSTGCGLPGIIKENDLAGNTLSIHAGIPEQTEKTYRIHIGRRATLSGLTVADQDGNDIALNLPFHRETYTYQGAVPLFPATVLKLTATATAGTAATLTIAAVAGTSGEEAEIVPAWSEDGSYSLPITVGEGQGKSEYTLQFTRQNLEITSLEVTKAPDKTTYVPGESFDPTGMEVTVHCDGEEDFTIAPSQFTYAPGGALTALDTAVTISYLGKTVEYPITMEARLEGEGTQEQPYALYSQEDLYLLDLWVEQGKTTADTYVRVMEDIVITGQWEGIGSTANPFMGDFDGGSHKISIPAGGKALFAKTRGAVIHDLLLYGEQIEDYGLVSTYAVDKKASYYAKFYRVTLVAGTKTLKSGFIGGYASGQDQVWIEDCHVEAGVVIGYDKSQSHIGSFGGEFNGSIHGCTSYASVYGVSWVGGIVANQGQSMADLEVQDCTFGGSVVATGNYVGGIVGGGYAGTNWGMETAPNAKVVTIKSCTNTGSVTGGNAVGGIYGAEACVQQCWPNGAGYILNNRSTGTVSATSGSFVGGIIGFMQSLNRYNHISGNYYQNAAKGIGGVAHVDTSAVTGGFHDGVFYYDTSSDSLDNINCVALQTYVELATIGKVATGNNRAVTKTDCNREDDPLGADMEKLCYTDAQIEAYVTELVAGGSYKTQYTVGDKLDLTGITLTAVWSDGEKKVLKLSDVTIGSYSMEKTGAQTITLSYQGAKADITIQISPKSTKIYVAVSILGDSHHESPSANGGPHGLARGGLTPWATESKVEADAKETVWDVIQRVCQKHGLSIQAKYSEKYNSYYIEGINGLAEFDNGANSGWMYTVNGVHPEVGVSAKYIRNGDKIVLHYTDDYSYEEGGNAYGKPTDSEQVQANQTAAKKVDALIDKIGTPTADSGPAITAAWEAYNALTDQQKKLVTKLEALQTATKKWNALLAQRVMDLIEKIPSPVTKDGSMAIQTARRGYDSLTEDQKALVTNYKTLTQAESALAKLNATQEDKEKAQAVIDQIQALAGFTGDKRAAVEAARAGYEALTQLQKQLVENLELLEAEEKILEQGISGEKFAQAFQTTGSYIQALGTPSVGSVGGEWMVIGLARSGLEIPDADRYYEGVVAYVREHIDENQRLHKAKSTDNSRLILALTAMGKDVTNVGGHNLLLGLNDMDFVKKQGNNGPIWALLALDCGNYPVPEGNVTRQGLLQEILAVQTPDGGWAISGTEADSDMTGMALQALAPYCREVPEVAAAVEKAVERLSRMQDADGGYSTFGNGGKVATSESISQVVVALTALGIDPNTDSRFVKNGSSALDALLRYYIPEGGFRHVADGDLDGMATEQAYYALTAYNRFLEGKTGLYDMTDVLDRGGDALPSVQIPVLSAPAVQEESRKDTISLGEAVLVLLFGIGLGMGGTLAVVLVIPKLKKKK